MTCEIAVDPLEGTDLVARGDSGAVAICAIGEPGGLLPAPGHLHAEAGGGRHGARAGSDIDAADPRDASRSWPAATAARCGTLTVDRARPAPPRGADRRRSASAGARIRLIPDGDITASLSVAVRGTGDHLYVGMGGSTEGVITAAALECLGAEIQAKMAPRDEADLRQDGRVRHARRARPCPAPATSRPPAVRDRHRRDRRQPAEGRPLLRRRGANALDRDGLGRRTPCASSTRCTCSRPTIIREIRSVGSRRLAVSDDSEFPFPFAFGEGAGEEFKERLKELMRAQREAFEEMQAESGGQPAAGGGPLAGRSSRPWCSPSAALADAGSRRPRPDEAADAMGLLFARSLTALQGALAPQRLTRPLRRGRRTGGASRCPRGDARPGRRRSGPTRARGRGWSS